MRPLAEDSRIVTRSNGIEVLAAVFSQIAVAPPESRPAYSTTALRSNEFGLAFDQNRSPTQLPRTGGVAADVNRIGAGPPAPSPSAINAPGFVSPTRMAVFPVLNRSSAPGTIVNVDCVLAFGPCTSIQPVTLMIPARVHHVWSWDTVPPNTCVRYPAGPLNALSHEKLPSPSGSITDS